MSVAAFPVMALDANGYPRHHREAQEHAIQVLADMVNELPSGIYHMHHEDARWIGESMISAYLNALKRQR